MTSKKNVKMSSSSPTKAGTKPVPVAASSNNKTANNTTKKTAMPQKAGTTKPC